MWKNNISLNQKNIWTGMLIVTLMMITVLLIWLNLTKIDDYLHSDIVAEANFAQQMWKQKTLFPDHWYYANELSAMRPTLLAAILYGITGDFVLSYSISIVICGVICVLALIYMLKSLDISFYSILIGCIAFLGFFGYNFIENLLLYYGYYNFYFLFTFLTIGYFIRAFGEKRILYKNIIRIILVASALMFGIMGIRMTQALYVPLLLIEIIIIILYLIENKPEEIRVDLFIETSILLLFNIVGIIIFKIFISKSGYLPNDMTSFMFLDVSEVVTKFKNVIPIILNSIDIKGNFPIISINGIDFCVKLFMLGLTILVVNKIRHKKETKWFRAMIFFSLSVSITIFIQSVTQLGFLYRYFFMLGCLITVTIVYVAEYIYKLSSRYLPVITIGVILIVGVNYCANFRPMLSYNGNLVERQVVDWLMVEGYEYGLASFWKSGLVKGLSNGKIEMTQLAPDINDSNAGNLKPFLWLTDEKLYDKECASRKTFLLVDDLEESYLLKNKDSILYKYNNIKVKEIEKFNIYEYNENPVVKFSMPELGHSISWYPSISEFIKINNAQIDDSDNSVISSGAEGYFIAGPYIDVRKGKYNISFVYDIESNNIDNLGFFDISKQSGNLVISKQSIDAGTDKVTFKNIILDSSEKVEFRAYANKDCRIKVKSINFERLE